MGDRAMSKCCLECGCKNNEQCCLECENLKRCDTVCQSIDKNIPKEYQIEKLKKCSFYEE